MKKLIIAALLVVSVSTFAQENTGKKNRSENGKMEMKSPEARAEARLKAMTKELSLDASQQEQMKKIIAEQATKMEAMRAKRMENKDAKPSKEERKAMMEKLKEERTATENRMKAFLNPTQFEKYKAMEEAIKTKMKERGGNGDRPNRADGEE